MGCFLACFGFHKRRKKRRPPSDRITIGDQIRFSYEPLDSSPITTSETSKNSEIQKSESRDEPKEQTWVKIRKKVSFNLNIQAYEPIPDDQYILDSDEVEIQNQKAANRTDSTSLAEKESTTSNSGSYLQNYRYQNCRDSSDEEDDFPSGESDLDDIETEEDHEECIGENKSCELESNTMDRSQHVLSVLKPVENLTQWRTAKAKSVTITNKQIEIKNKTSDSEQPQSPVPLSSNLSLTPPSFRTRLNSCLKDPMMQENMVNASLSDWLA